MKIKRIVARGRKKSTGFSIALRILSVSMALVVLGLVTVAQTQVIPPRYQQGAYNPNVSLPNDRLCTACADGSVPSGSWAVSLDSPSIASDTLSFAINLHPVTDVPASGTSTARDFVTVFQMNLGFTTGLTQTGCTRTFGSEFTRDREGSVKYTTSKEANLRGAGAITVNSLYAAVPTAFPGSDRNFAQLPESSSDALLVATVTCPIASSTGVAGVSLLGAGYTSNNKRLTQLDNDSYSQEVLTIASSNLLNYPLDGTTQYLTRVGIHSDGAGVDLHFAQSVPSSPNNINNAAFRLNSSGVTSYTSQAVDADTLRYRFDSGVALSGGQELEVTRNGDYYGISATTLTAIPYTFFADAPYIASTPTVNASNTQVTVAFDTSIYNDPVSASAFRLVLTTTSSAVSLATISSVTATASTGEFVLAVNTENPATGTERFNVELVLDGIGAGADPGPDPGPYRAAYPYQSAATNLAFNDVAPPVITVVSDFSDVNSVKLTVTDDDPVTTTITYRRIADRTCDVSTYASGTSETTVIEGTSFSIGGPSDSGFSEPYCFRSVDAAGNLGFALNEPLDLISADLVTNNTSGQITSFLGGIGQTDIWVGFSEEVSWRSSPTGGSATGVQTISISQLTVTYVLDTTSTVTTAIISSADFYPSVQVGLVGSPQALLRIVLGSGLPLGIEAITVAYVDATAGGDGIYDTAGDREIGNSDCGGTRTCNNETTNTVVSQASRVDFATLDTDGDGLPDVFENSNSSADPFQQTDSERTFTVTDQFVALSAINQLPFSDGQKTDASLSRFYTHVGVTTSTNPALGRVRAPVVFDLSTQPSGCDLSSGVLPANWVRACTQFDLASVNASVTLAWLAMDTNGIWVVNASNNELPQNTVTLVDEVSFPARSLYVDDGTGSFSLVGSGASGLKADAVVVLSPEDTTSASFTVSSGTLSFSGLTEGVPYRLGFNTTDADIWAVSEYTSSSTNPSLGEVSLGVPAQTYLVWDNGSPSNNAYGILAALGSTLTVVGESDPRFALQRNTTHTLDVTFGLVGLTSEGTLGVPLVVDSTNTQLYVGDLHQADSCSASSAGVSCTFFVVAQSSDTFSLPVRLVQQVSVTDPDSNVSTQTVSTQTAEFGNIYRVLIDSSEVVRDTFTSFLPLYVDDGTTLNMTFNIPQSSLAPSGFVQSFDIGAFAITTGGVSLVALDAARCAGIFGNCGSNEFAHNFQANGVVPGVLTIAGVANYRGGLVEVIIPLSSDQAPSRIALNKISASGASTPFSVLDADGDWGVSARVSNVGGVCPKDTGIVGSAYRDSSGVLNRGVLASVTEALCIFVQIRDGGANDLDGARVPDGIVIDPLGIDLDASGDDGDGSGGGGGGGALGIPETVVLLLLALGVLAVGSISRRRRNVKVLLESLRN